MTGLSAAYSDQLICLEYKMIIIIDQTFPRFLNSSLLFQLILLITLQVYSTQQLGRTGPVKLYCQTRNGFFVSSRLLKKDVTS